MLLSTYEGKYCNIKQQQEEKRKEKEREFQAKREGKSTISTNEHTEVSRTLFKVI